MTAPPRICSFVPGATEIVAALGRGHQLVGRSHECDYPQALAAVPVLSRPSLSHETAGSAEIDQAVRAHVADGAPLSLIDEAALCAAAPDLVITQELCHVCGITPTHVQQPLSKCSNRPRVLTTSPSKLDDLISDVLRIGDAIGATDTAHTLAQDLAARKESVRRRCEGRRSRPRVVCLEWLDPLYAAGHWIPEMVALAGGEESLGRAGAPSRQVEWAEVAHCRPEIVILMPCGYSLSRTVEEYARQQSRWPWEALPASQSGCVYAVDANAYFSRPGPRLFQGLEILADIIAAPAASSLPQGAQRCLGPRAMA